MLKILVSSFVVLFLSHHVKSSRILAFIPTASYSHQMFYQQLWREFAIRGHEIIVISPDPTNETLPNLKEINIRETHVLSHQLARDVIDSNILTMLITNEFAVKYTKIMEFELRLPQVQELINNKDEFFDLLILEHFPGPMFGLQHRFNCSLIGVISVDAMDFSHELMGNPVHSLLYPIPLFNTDENSSIFERIMALLTNTFLNLSTYRNIDNINRIAKDIFGSNTPSIMELFEKTDMLFVNANPLFNAVRPHTPSTISIAGGLHLKPPKPLPKDIQEYLDNAKDGVIYFSLGSSVKTNELTGDLHNTILQTLAQLPYKVLWKFEDDSIKDIPVNVKLIKWAPQQDVLRHKNVKLFITQGGLQSLEETIYLHVPVVVLPIMVDQHSNGAKAQSEGLGLVVNKDNLSVKEFKSAILEVITNPIYRETVKRFASQIQDTPMTSLERAVWWSEYVLRHKGAQHLKGPIIPWYQYYYIDVLSLIGLICLVLLSIIFLSIRFCIQKLFRLSQYFKNHSTVKNVKQKKM